MAATVLSPIIELQADVNSKQPGLVKLYNETDQVLTLEASIEKFVSADESGRAKFLPAQDGDEFINWFILSAGELTLQPKQAAVVPFLIEVPENAAPGGYYAVIFWRTKNSGQDGQVQITSKVGTLVFLEVKGEIKKQVELLDFTVDPARGLYWGMPLSFSARIKNSGNIHLRPVGEIKIQSLLGSSVLAVNPGSNVVLPGSIRKYETVLGQPKVLSNYLENLNYEIKNFNFGKCRATLELAYDKNQPPLEAQVVFWYLPINILAAGLVVIIIVGLLVLARRRIKILKNKAHG